MRKRNFLILFLFVLFISALNCQNFPPPENLHVVIYNDNPQLVWDPPSILPAPPQELIQYGVYCDDSVLAYITSGLFPLWNFYEGTFTFFVTAIYENPSGESCPSNEITVNIDFATPENLTGTVQGNDIYLEWNPPTNGTYLTNYEIYRNDEFILETTELSYLDEDLSLGEYSFYIIGNYYGNSSDPSNTLIIELTNSDDLLINSDFSLSNFPNPFNPSTTISFNLNNDQNEQVEISIYNLKGQKVKTFSNLQITQSPNQQIIWNGTDDNKKSVSSGIYFYKLKIEGKTQAVRKCLLLK